MDPEHWVNEGFALRQQVDAFSGAGAPQILSRSVTTIRFRRESWLSSGPLWSVTGDMTPRQL
jgi:hypothetical protein